MTNIQFIYFDLGRVILDFSHEHGFEQMAHSAHVSTELVRRVMVEQGLSDRYEAGELSTTEFHQLFCTATGADLTCDELSLAWGDIFEIIPQTVRVAANLRAAGFPLGILSNTCEAHWLHALRRYSVLSQLFDVVVTSYDAKSMKPDKPIYDVAAQRAGVAPRNLFFVDDRLENVEAAIGFGWNAVQFTHPLALANDLEQLGVAFNR